MNNLPKEVAVEVEGAGGSVVGEPLGAGRAAFREGKRPAKLSPSEAIPSAQRSLRRSAGGTAVRPATSYRLHRPVRAVMENAALPPPRAPLRPPLGPKVPAATSLRESVARLRWLAPLLAVAAGRGRGGASAAHLPRSRSMAEMARARARAYPREDPRTDGGL
jgi:hypothetical protein